MAEILTNNKYYYDIADTIRQMKEVNTTYKPREMASALKDIYSNEVEGVPPLSFEANGNNLLNYRIDGASGGVGERTKNLLQNTATSQTINGVTFTVNNDGSVTCNGTVPANKIPTLLIPVYLESNVNYKLTGTPINTEYKYQLDIRNSAGTLVRPLIYDNNGSGVNFTINTTGEYKCGVRIQSEYTCNNLTFYPMIRLASIQDDTYEPYGYKVPVVISGKNLFDETQVPDKSISTETSNFQIFKQNGKLIVNGITTSSQVDTEISKTNGVNNQALDFINNNADNYIFTSSVPGRIMIRYKLIGSDIYRYTFDEYNSNNRIADRVVFRLQQNYQYNNEDMNIMIKSSKIQSTNYEPYIEPTTTTIYLDEPIEENESISLSDTNTNIPTIRGTNVLTVDTTVQPSNVYIQAPKDSLEAIQIANRLEEI